jgi:hypothetical protein
VAVLVALVLPLFVAAADPSADAAPKPPSVRDLTLTVHARRLLLEDPVLSPLNLNVRIKDNSARLWGLVPTEELRSRARKKIEQMPGVFFVHNEIVVGLKPPEPLQLQPDGPTHSEAASPDPVTGSLAVLTGRSPGALDPSVRQDSQELPPQAAALGPPVASGPKDFEQARQVPAGNDRVLGIPETGPDAVDAAIERIRAADPRFRAVPILRRDAALILHATSDQAELAMALARQLAHVPGIESVHIQPVRSGR